MYSLQMAREFPTFHGGNNTLILASKVDKDTFAALTKLRKKTKLNISGYIRQLIKEDLIREGLLKSRGEK